MTRPRRRTGARVGRIITAFSFAMAGNGLLLTALGIRAGRAGFDAATTGAILSGYYVGFLVGTRHARPIMRRLGAARALMVLMMAMAVICAAPALAEVAGLWIVLRIAQGYTISACYVVVETWLNTATGNDRRGRLLGIYMVCAMASFAVGAFMLRFTGSDGVRPFVAAGLLTGFGALIMRGTHATAVSAPARENLAVPLRQLFGLVPIGVVLAALVGFSNGAFASVAVFAERAGLDDAHTALVSAITGLGPIVVLFPLSALSDRMSRPAVIAVSAAVAATLFVITGPMTPGEWPMLTTLVLAGGLTLTLYTLTVAATNDGIVPDQMASASGQIVLLYGIGATLGPFAATTAMAWLGPDGYFWANAAPHAAVVAAVVMLSRRGRGGVRPPDRTTLAAVTRELARRTVRRARYIEIPRRIRP
jgi:MFS family permease